MVAARRLADGGDLGQPVLGDHTLEIAGQRLQGAGPALVGTGLDRAGALYLQ
jgi:hypothetical protein